MDAIQCLIFSVDFDENIISFKVPPAVLERGIKYGHASIDFRAITGNSKTQQGEPKPLPTTQVKTPAAPALVGEICPNHIPLRPCIWGGAVACSENPCVAGDRINFF